ncbi:hypothetical protein Tco_1414061, partial [Tanacetum coccineum]
TKHGLGESSMVVSDVSIVQGLHPEEVAVAWDDDGNRYVVNRVTAMATVSGEGSEMVRCGGSGRSEWSSGVWHRLWVRRILAGKGGRKI